MDNTQSLTSEQLENLRSFLTKGVPDSVDPMNPCGHYNKFKYACTFEQVNDNHELALLVMKAYPELIGQVSIRLKSNAKFILEATSDRFNEKDEYLYRHCAEELHAHCGPVPNRFMGNILSTALGTPSPEEEWKTIRAKLAEYAKAQEEQETLKAKLTTTAAQAKQKAKFKL